MLPLFASYTNERLVVTTRASMAHALKRLPDFAVRETPGLVPPHRGRQKE